MDVSISGAALRPAGSLTADPYVYALAQEWYISQLGNGVYPIAI